MTERAAGVASPISETACFIKEIMKDFLLKLFSELSTKLVNRIITASRTLVFGKKDVWEGKLKERAKKDGWNANNSRLLLALILLFLTACAPAAIFLPKDQAVMLAEDKKVKCWVLAEDGSRYRTAVRLKAGSICGSVDFN